MGTKEDNNVRHFISTLLPESKYNHTCTHINSRYEGDEGVSDRTPWCCGAEMHHVHADAQESRGLLIRSAKPDHWAVCGGGDGRPGASWERCVHSPCARFHSHAWNIPEHGRSSLQTGKGNLESRILQRIIFYVSMFCNGYLTSCCVTC